MSCMNAYVDLGTGMHYLPLFCFLSCGRPFGGVFSCIIRYIPPSGGDLRTLPTGRLTWAENALSTLGAPQLTATQVRYQRMS